MHFLRTIVTLGLAISLTFAPTLAQAAEENPYNRAPNHLEGVASPYLQQHVYNAVDWYPWGPEALSKAQRENKPIFLSIGYSTCYWCHVMSRESFDDDEIGAFLNENFVSIKIDRERRPDLDEQFMLVTQIIAGNGGWPNSVFLTNEGEPFYAGTYFPPAQFLDLLHQINGLWTDQRQDVIAEGTRIGDTIRTYMSRTEEAKALTPEAIANAADSLLDSVDVFYGGFGVAPKFPREANMLLLLDQAERRADIDLLTTVTNALDGMIKGGIHDQVGGGFHRYTTDEAWQIPHFEKMLYNQALIGRMLIRAYEATGEFRYKRAATRTFDFVIRELSDPEGGFYSAQDAASLGPEGRLIEGPFYLWTPDEVTAILGEEAEFAINVLSIIPGGNFERSNIPHLADFPSSDEQEFYQILDTALEAMRLVRLTRPTPHRDEKIVVDWNASMIETLAEAASVLERPDYYTAAARAAQFINSTMLGQDGQLARVSFEGVTGVTAQLSDYAGLGLAYLALYDHALPDTDKQPLLERAQFLANQLATRFASNSPGQAAFRMTAIPEGLGVFYPIDDSEVPAGNGLTLALFDGLAKRTGDPQFARQATLLAAALSGQALAAPSSRAYTLSTAMSLSHGEIGSMRYLANGVVKVTSNLDRDTQLATLNIQIKQGWHVNANVPLEDYLIPTELSIFGQPIAANDYPEPVVKSLGFNNQPLALHEGELILSAQLPDQSQEKPGQLLLKIQACSDEICLAPEEVVFTVW